MAQSRRASELRQLELVDTALGLIAAEGLGALSTRRLARQLELSSAAVFRHFPTRDALWDAIVARVEAVLDETYPPADLPPAQALRSFVRARTSAVGDHLGVLRLVQSEQFHLALPARASTRLRVCVEKSRRFLVACIARGQRDGSLRADVTAEDAALLVMGAIQLLAAVPDRQASAREALGTLLQVSPVEARERVRSES